MTDRELLEAAARAAGLDFRWEAGFPSETEEPTVFDEEGFGDYWNPLVEDGDALRLAVKLNLDIRYDTEPDGAVACVIAAWHPFQIDAVELLNKDSCAATRRAIVRAAASLTSEGKDRG